MASLNIAPSSSSAPCLLLGLLAPLALGLNAGCGQPFGDLGDFTAGTVASGTSTIGEPDGPTEGTQTTAGSEETETGAAGGQCDVSDPLLFYPERYTGLPTPMHAACVLTAAGPAPNGGLLVELDCDAKPVKFTVASGPEPDLTSRIGATVQLDTDAFHDDVGAHDLAWIVLREAGTLLYAGVVGDSLLPAGTDAGLYAPLTVEPVLGPCALESLYGQDTGTGGPPQGDAYGCEHAARMQLGVTVGDAPQLLLEGGQSSVIAVDGGSYTIDVRAVVRGVDCFPDAIPGVEEYTYAFAIAFAPG